MFVCSCAAADADADEIEINTEFSLPKQSKAAKFKENFRCCQIMGRKRDLRFVWISALKNEAETTITKKRKDSSRGCFVTA